MGPIGIVARAGLAATGIVVTGLCPPAAAAFAALAAPVALSDSRRYAPARSTKPVRPRGVAARRAKPAASR